MDLLGKYTDPSFYIPGPVKRLIGFDEGMDFVGQAQVVTYYRTILNIFLVIGFIVGYVTQNFNYGAFVILAGALLAFLICLPAWPMFRKNPLKWNTQ